MAEPASSEPAEALGPMGGLGFGMAYAPEQGEWIILGADPGGPAAVAGLERGQVVRAVAGVRLDGLRPGASLEDLFDARATMVAGLSEDRTVTVARDGVETVVSLPAASDPSVQSARVALRSPDADLDIGLFSGTDYCGFCRPYTQESRRCYYLGCERTQDCTDYFDQTDIEPDGPWTCDQERGACCADFDTSGERCEYACVSQGSCATGDLCNGEVQCCPGFYTDLCIGFAEGPLGLLPDPTMPEPGCDPSHILGPYIGS